MEPGRSWPPLGLGLTPPGAARTGGCKRASSEFRGARGRKEAGSCRTLEEPRMRLGVSLAQVGRLAGPASVRSAAVAAEQVGYSSIWVHDRLLAPVDPRSPYDGVPGAELPPEHANALDPLSVLTYAAA